MPVGVEFTFLIDATGQVPSFYAPEDSGFLRNGMFVRENSTIETQHTQGNPHHVEAHEDSTPLFMRIHEAHDGQAAEHFAQSAVIFQRGESVGVAVYVRDQKIEVPVIAFRVPTDAQAFDVMVKWPDRVAIADVEALV